MHPQQHLQRDHLIPPPRAGQSNLDTLKGIAAEVITSVTRHKRLSSSLLWSFTRRLEVEAKEAAILAHLQFWIEVSYQLAPELATTGIFDHIGEDEISQELLLAFFDTSLARHACREMLLARDARIPLIKFCQALVATPLQ